MPVLLFVVLAAFSQQSLPKFEDYPATETWNGIRPPLQLDTKAKNLYRTRLHEAAKGAPNFAGKLREAVWGCGSNCHAGGFIDLSTGRVVSLPGPSELVVCGFAYDETGLEYRFDSRLVILRCGWKAGRYEINDPDRSYLLWEGDHFRLLRRVPGPRKKASGFSK